MQPEPSSAGTDRESVNAAPPSVTNHGTATLIEIGVHGRWSHHLGTEVSAGIRRRLAEHPSAVIIDLDDLFDPDGASLALWLATRRVCSVTRPPIRLALCLPNTTMLDRRLRRITANRLPRFTTMPEARAAMTNDRKTANTPCPTPA
jgi:hypothetical protein